MTLPVLAIDIDDTIADSTESLRLAANLKTGLNIPPEAYKVPGSYWGYYERVWAKHGVNDRYTYAHHRDEMNKDQSSVALIEGAHDALRELSGQFRIVFITSRNELSSRATKTWLKTHFPDLQYELYFATNHTDKTALSKGQIAKQLGAMVLIDDNDDHCRSAVDVGITAIRFGSYGWHHEPDDAFISCLTWQDVMEYLRGA